MSDICAAENREATAGISLDALFREEYGRVRGLAWHFGLPADEIDDAAQEVFALACAGLARFRGECAPATWLTRIAVNHLTSRKRALVRRLRVFSREGVVPERVPAPTRNAPEGVEAREIAAACIRRLPAKLRVVLVLRYIEGMSCAEVAETLDISDATVRTRTYNARKQLRRILRRYEL